MFFDLSLNKFIYRREIGYEDLEREKMEGKIS